MAIYRVISQFTDLQDNGFEYKVGDTYPREGVQPDADRFFELSTDANQRGIPLIEEVQTKAETAAADKAESAEDAPVKRGRRKSETK